MTQEEKAKAYDKALEIAKAWCKLDNNDLSNEDLETLFPELKESEDERIRKEMIDFMSSQLKSLMPPCPSNETLKTWIAWLEKQGVQKPAWSEEDEKMLNDIIVGLTSMEQRIFTHDVQGKTQIQGRIDWLKSLKERMKGE